MANIYVKSTIGSDAFDGSTWLLAKASVDNVDGATSIDAAGDTIYLSQSHAESTAAAVTLAFAGTNASPTRMICGDDAAEPPTAVATTASISTTGASNLTIQGAAYIYGVKFNAGSGNSISILSLNNATAAAAEQTYDNCELAVVSISGSSSVAIGSSSAQLSHKTSFKNSKFKFGNTAYPITINHTFQWDGGSIMSGSSTPTVGAFAFGPRGGSGLVSGVDFSNFTSGVHLVKQGSIGLFVFRNCKLPASWTGNLVTGTILGRGFRVEMYNCDNADTNYRLWIEDYAGSIKSETTLIRTGGASDGATGLSWKMASSANCSYPAVPLESGEFVIWNDTTGSSKTATVEILHDSATNLTDGEIWLEVQYLGTSGYPLGSFITDAKADVLTTAADQTTSSATWTTTGMSNPNTQKLSVTFTPQEKGPIYVKVIMTKASKTVYVDPVITVS